MDLKNHQPCDKKNIESICIIIFCKGNGNLIINTQIGAKQYKYRDKVKNAGLCKFWGE